MSSEKKTEKMGMEMNEPVGKIDNLQCDECEYSARNERALFAHQKHKHHKIFEEIGEIPVKKTKKKINIDYLDDVPRVTTKQLLGGRKRPRTVIDEGGEFPELGEHDADMPLGEFVARRNNTIYKDRRAQYPTILEEAEIIAGEELEVVEEEEVVASSEHGFSFQDYSPRSTGFRRPPKKYTTGSKLPQKLTEGDVGGKYKCYIEDCAWRCNYRSLRMEHMKAVHPEWKMPPRYLLERISKDGVYLDPDEYVPPIACTVQGCEWRGNYRASRSAHMRKVHPREHAESKKKLPGYNSTGKYTCHFPMCTWRGFSRSTRSTHLKKAHPQWRPEDSRSQSMLTCFHCKASFPSYPLLLNHIDKQHDGCGMHIDEIFDGHDSFGDWLESVERDYSITFERTDPPAQPTDAQIYTLHCTCIGARGIQLAEECRNHIYHKHNFFKRRAHQLLTRTKNDCAVHLEVREDALYDRVSVKGTLEHTGHRFGTPLIRISSSDRMLYSELLNARLDDDPLLATELVEKLTIFEGFTMENYEPPKSIELIEPVAESPIESLRIIIEEQSDTSCFFGVDFGGLAEHGKFSFGYMSPEMQKMWMNPKRGVTIDVTVVEFDEMRSMYQYTVIMHTNDNKFLPRCVLIYMSTEQEGAPAVVLNRLREVNPSAPPDFMTDPSQCWVDTIASTFPGSQALISEWTLMEYWAMKVEEHVDNELDVFSIVSALRRMLRVEENHQLLFIATEFFESMYECGYSGLAEFFDAQFSDQEYFRRWNPNQRYDHNSHALPTLGVSSRILREIYVDNEGFERIDQWFAHAVRRIDEFNEIEETQTYTLRPIDFTPRKYFYNSIDYQKELLVYQDDVVDGEYVVEDEIVEEVEEVVEEHVVMEEELVEEEEILYHDEIIVKQEEVEAESKEIHRIHMEQEPSTSSPPPPPPTEHPEHHEMPRGTIQLPRILTPAVRKKSPPLITMKRRDTTKEVVRGRCRKERFAELRDCPPEVMRAMAAYAICHDGRRKEQHAFAFVPSPAQMAQSTVPVVVETPNSSINQNHLRHFYLEEGRGELITRDKTRELEHREYLERFNRQMQQQQEQHEQPSTSSAQHDELHYEEDDEVVVEEEMLAEQLEEEPSSSSIY